MRFDQDLFERAAATEEEKSDLLPVVRRLAELAATSVRDGLLALDARVDESDPFTANALRNIVDGTDPRALEQELRGALASVTLRGKALLERMLISEAMMGIANGVSPSVLELKMLSMLGERLYRAGKDRAPAEG